ncbi:polymerase [Tai Forest hepadnavirus]|uniref:Protein P n=1 Tax=Tai Forest hepadnavirus TaxID=2557875 RepID=A0A482KFS9_9HEPA|nr:polymerase [Tai Forest hepadnavirus]QBQ18423.1 polymerase [Tai Forest hepadnavirus]
MHPFSQLFRNIPSYVGEDLELLLEAPPEDALPRLADVGLNLHVADALNLQLPEDLTAEQWVHKVGNLLGLYTEKPREYNKEWKTPRFPNIHLKETLITNLSNRFGPLTPAETRRFKLSLPARFFPVKTKYLPLHKGIKNYYPSDIIHHFITTADYLWTLWESGILYLRVSQKQATFNGSPYSWEQRRLHNGTQSVCSEPFRVSSFSFNRSHRRTRLGQKPSQRSLATGSEPFTRKLGTPISSPTWKYARKRGTAPSRWSDTDRPITTQKGEETNSSHSSNQDHPSSFVHKTHDFCLWAAFKSTNYCSPFCLKHLVDLLDDWGPCTQDGEHRLRVPRTPLRITGGVFLVDKNPVNRTESRLVVDFSQFSRGNTAVRWPKFAVPNLRSLTNLLSCDLYWLSLDVSAAFYHIPLSPGSMPHLLVGSPGLQGIDPGMSYRAECGNPGGLLQDLHTTCRRGYLDPLLLLFKKFGRKLHLLSHPFVMGFRKIPMGVGLSPFLLAQFTSALASVVRRAFPHCLAFTYMDDVVLGARSPEHLNALHSTITALFLDLGITLNPEKTKWWGKNLNFMGLTINSFGSLPQDRHKLKALTMLKSLPLNVPIDWKICQRITGLLGFLAPFTKCGYAALMPLYNVIQAKKAFVMHPNYCKWLTSLYSDLWPVARQRSRLCQVFADATPTGWGLVNYSTDSVRLGTFSQPLPIHCAELLSACFARCWTGASLLGVDNQVVASGKYTHYPWLLGCAAAWILRGTSFIYVPSDLNPADAPSRGLLGFRRFPPPLLFVPSTGRTSLYARSPPVPGRQPVRVSFASPVLTSGDAWEPP